MNTVEGPIFTTLHITMKQLQLEFSIRSFILLVLVYALGGSMKAKGTDGVYLNEGMVIDSLDTVYFNIREAVCTGPYIDIPLHIQSDDDVYAIDFAVKLNVTDLTFQSVQNYKSYLYESANFNSGDSTLRFTSFSLVPIENDSFIVGVRFNKSDGYINGLDFTNTTAQLNGDFCSFKVIDTDPEPVLSTGPSVTIQQGDSAHIIVSSVAGSSFLWSTGDSSNEIYVDSAGTYQVTVTSPGSGCASVFSVNVSVAVPLPVEFGEITAASMNEGFVVDWFTYTESMNDYFIVERSVNGIYWQDIGFVDGAGWSSRILHYSFYDAFNSTDDLYYRVRQTDFNGDFTWSPVTIAHVDRNGQQEDVIVFPNPCRNFVNVRLAGSSGINRIRLFDGKGVLVYNKEIFPDEIQQGLITIPLDQSWSDKVLMLELSGSSERRQVTLLHLP